jgi:hypothetical protein
LKAPCPFVHGSQGCASYYRSTLNRHFREPAPAVSDAMTEDGAVFGGQNNLFEGLENAYKLYEPKMIAVFTSCMPRSSATTSTPSSSTRNGEHMPEDFPVPYANTRASTAPISTATTHAESHSGEPDRRQKGFGQGQRPAQPDSRL